MNMPPAKMYDFDITLQKSPLPEIEMKLAFVNAGSAYDPPGKEGLASLTAAMIAEAGSRLFTINEINAALYPVAGSFNDQADKELTTFTGRIHRDNWHNYLHLVLDQLVKPGFRDEDFKRLKEAQLTALTQDLRSNNEEELGKERLQTDIFAGTAYAHPALGTVDGISAITIDDVKAFAATHYTRGNLMIGLNGDVPDGFQEVMRAILGDLPASGAPAARVTVTATRPTGLNVDIIRKDTRSTAISFGLPITVTRASPDFAALSVARSWLGEHRQGGRLYDRIREIRGMNYGDYSYIEAFPRGMFQFFPDPNTPRGAQIFEVWIRPVVPANAHMALRIATAELQQLIDSGMTQADFENTRDYLMKNVYVMTQTQDQQLGYALDSKWYGIPEFTGYMRGALGRLTLADVNAAIRKHLSATDLDVVMITKDADGLRDALVSDAFSPITYDGTKPAALLAEDKVIGARKLNIPADRVKITDVTAVFSH
jgi:zinc protease